MIVTCYGYSSYTPFDVQNWFIYYAMLVLGKSLQSTIEFSLVAKLLMLHPAPINFVAWKVLKRTKFVKPLEADLIWERPTLDAYEATFFDPPTSFWREMIQLVGIGRKKGLDRRMSEVEI